MNINATLFVQMISFLLFVLFTKKFVWPPIVNAMKEREDTIANGIAEGERGRFELAEAQKKSQEVLKEAREQATGILESANKQADQIVSEHKKKAKEQADKILQQAELNAESAFDKARKELIQEMAELIFAGAKSVVGENLNREASNDLIEQAINKVEEA